MHSDESAWHTQVAELASDSEKRQALWASFTHWIATQGLHFDVVIDGANVGYYKKAGFVSGSNLADHAQIDAVSSSSCTC